MQNELINIPEARYALALNLATCEHESQVIDFLKTAMVWDDDSYWRSYGGIENNFSSIGNQQERADQALVEKLINSSDAILLLNCLSSGVDPTSQSAPGSIRAALKEYLGYPDGRLANIGSKARSALASDSIGLVASGARGRGQRPTYTVFDKGCGQAPENFENTFLSLNQSNKIKIPFVQGKFNMGSTGALTFCGQQNIQLIISRREPSVASAENVSSDWGFTVVRRVPPAGNMKSSQYKYLTNAGGDVFTIEADSLPILPGATTTYGEPLNYGSFVKMYDYEIGPALGTALTFDLYNRLSLLLPEMPIPVRLYERRDFSGHSKEATLAGLDTRLEDDRNENLEAGFPASAIVDLEGSQLKVQILAFKAELDDKGKKVNRKEKYARNEGVVFSVNGQAQGFFPASFFQRKSKLGFIKDSVLVIVDCSELTPAQHEDLFMNSRDRLRDTGSKRDLERKLEEIINDHRGLKELQNRRREEALRNKIEDDAPLAETLQSVLRSSPVLTALLSSGVRLPNPIAPSSTKTEGEFVGQKFPTFFKTEKTYSESNRRIWEAGRTTRIRFVTDAVNDYFSRPDSPGRLSVKDSFGNELDWRGEPWNGVFILSIDFVPLYQCGSTLDLIFELSDVDKPEPIVLTVPCQVVEKTERKGGGQRQRDSHAPNNKGNKPSKTGGLALPEIVPIKQEQWEEKGYDKETALTIEGSAEEWTYFFNADNVHLKTEQKRAKAADHALIEQQYQTALILMGLVLVNKHQKTVEESDDGENSVEAVEDYVSGITRALSPVLIPMIKNLGGLNSSMLDGD